MKKQRLQKLQTMLKEEQGELQELEERLSGPGGLGASMNDATGELSAYDNHPGDYGSEMHERSKDLGLLQMTRKQIAEIEEAQESIRDGNYGSAAIAGRRYPKNVSWLYLAPCCASSASANRKTKTQTIVRWKKSCWRPPLAAPSPTVKTA